MRTVLPNIYIFETKAWFTRSVLLFTGRQRQLSRMQTNWPLYARLFTLRLFRMSQTQSRTRQKTQSFHGPPLWSDPLRSMRWLRIRPRNRKHRTRKQNESWSVQKKVCNPPTPTCFPLFPSHLQVIRPDHVEPFQRRIRAVQIQIQICVCLSRVHHWP